MANWFVDTGLGTGSNDGTTLDDAWQSIETAMESSGYTPGDVIWIRRRSSETQDDDINAADDGSPSSPLYFIGCPRAEDGAGSGTWANGSNEINDVSGLEMKYTQHVGRRVKQDTDGKWYLITYVPYIRGTGIAFVDSDPDTITDTGSDFVNRGIEAGDKIRVTGTDSNDGTYTVASVVAGTITLDGGDSLTAEAAGDDVTIQVYDRFLIDREYAGSNTGAFTIQEDDDYDLFNGSETFTTTHASELCTTGTAHPWKVGDCVRLTTTDTLPNGYATGTNYYVIPISSTTLKLANSYANALAGTVVSISDDGAGTHTMQTIVDGTITKANWNGDDDDLPLIDFNEGARSLALVADTYYVWKNLWFRDSTDPLIDINVAEAISVIGCLLTQNQNDRCISTTVSQNNLYLERVVMDGNGTGTGQIGMVLLAGAKMIDSAIYGMGDYGIQCQGKLEMINCNLGVEVANGDSDISIGYYVNVIGIDVSMGGSNGYTEFFQYPHRSNFTTMGIENYGKVLGEHRYWFSGGDLGSNGSLRTVDVDNTDNRPNSASTAGSTTDIIEIRPNSSGFEYIPDWAIEVFCHEFEATTDSKTYTYYIQNYSCGTLNEGQAIRDIWLECRYVDSYDDTSEYNRTIVYSTETSIAERADADDWDSLSVASIQPAVASKVRIRMFVSKYDADGLIFVDPKPVLT